MGGYPTGPEECAPPECEPRITSLGDPGPIAVFVFWGLVVAYLSLYFLVKFFRTRRHYVSPTRLDLTVQRASKSEQKDTKLREQVWQKPKAHKQHSCQEGCLLGLPAHPVVL